MSGRIQRLGWARLMASKFFDSACTIRRQEEDLVGPLEGGQFACTVFSLFEGGRIEGEYTSVNSWSVQLPVDTDVLIDDYITEKGRTFQVIEIPSPESYEPFMTVICSRVG